MGANDKSAEVRVEHFDLPPEEAQAISGNVALAIKQRIGGIIRYFTAKGVGFGDEIGGRLEVTDVSVVKKTNEPEKEEARVVCEIDATEDMLNGGGSLHGGCAAFLIDVCSTLPISAYSLATGGSGDSGVSQVIDVVYHSPARLGERLRIVSTSLTIGARSMSARCEIWNATHHRLVASGTHIKMQPSQPKAKL